VKSPRPPPRRGYLHQRRGAALDFRWQELGVNLCYAGHYATETFGVRALAAPFAGFHLQMVFHRSTQWIVNPGLVRVTGIEPVSHAWEAHVLPLNYTRRALFRGNCCLIIRRIKEIRGFQFPKYFQKTGEKRLARSGIISRFYLLESAGIA
jgi:hypothetical protein